jgi:hypothetical protein
MGFRFSDYVALIQQLLAGREHIVDSLEHELFSSRGKGNARNGDRESVGDGFDTCIFESPTLSRDLSRLKGRLAASHVADGFVPVRDDRYARELDPVELVLRACHYWDHDRWPGRAGRIAYTHYLYAVFMLRQLEYLSLRIWDDGNDAASAHLGEVQRLLDRLGSSFVRDARWLVQTAQGPLTGQLRPYFATASKISESLSEADRLEVMKAGVVLAGGHLRSQLRHRSRDTRRSFDDPVILSMTRSSSSMDLALLIGDLIPLLSAYSDACARQDARQRMTLADAILQGLSADPELLLTRIDLLAPSVMVEDLFVERTETGRMSYTAMGEAHRKRVTTFATLIAGTVESLRQDSLARDPARAPYSPLGIVYGFCGDLFSNMVLSTLRSAGSPNLSIEDMFASIDRLDEKGLRAREWERLPKGEAERNPFEHSTGFAAQIFTRMAAALDARRASGNKLNASEFATSCLRVVPRGVDVDALSGNVVPAGVVSAQKHCLTTDVARASATGATAFPKSRLLADRAEGRFLASAMSEGEWFAVSKAALTMCAREGRDALITDVPSGVIDVLRLTCPEHLVVIDGSSSS